MMSPIQSGFGSLSVEVVESRQALATMQDDWDDLAANSLEPNVFYESWMLLPALDAFAGQTRFQFVLVYDQRREDSPQKPLLCGLFPFERVEQTTPIKPVSLPMLRLWKHRYCFLCSPLIRRGYGQFCLSAVFDWLRRDNRGITLIQFNDILGTGPFADQLKAFLTERQLHHCVQKYIVRAKMQCSDDAEQYLKTAMSGRFRKKVRRYRRRLAELGRFAAEDWSQDQDPNSWIGRYLDLEARGWKGREGTAIALHARDRNWFAKVVESGLRRNQVRMPTFSLNGKPIAMQVNLLSPPGSFAFKTAYNENFAGYSPGTLLEVENIARVHQMEQIEWMDSCAEPNHPTMNRVYSERRAIQTVLVPAYSLTGQCAVRCLPLLRPLRRLFP